MTSEIVFKCEDSLWQMMKHGEKTWDARRWDMSDDRIYALSQFWFVGKPGVPSEARTAGVPFVTFLNKATGEVLALRYLGLEFADWTPGWCFLRLGGME